MSLDVSHSLSQPDDVSPKFGIWLWMMYGHMAPTREELVHMSLHLLGIVPIIGTIAEGYNTYLYYIEGDAVSALINAGVVVISAIGDCFLIVDIVGATKFTFSQNARCRLAAMPDTEISKTVDNLWIAFK